MVSFESTWLRHCSNDFRPVLHRRHIWVVFCHDHVHKSKEYFISKYPNVNFPAEQEKNDCFFFSDVLVIGENGQFATLKFIEIYINFKIFIFETYQVGFIKSFLFRCFRFCSDFAKFYHEVDNLKSILHKNRYFHDLVDKYIKEYLDKILAPKSLVSTIPNKDLVIVLLYFGNFSLQIRKRIICIMKRKFPYCNIWFVLQTKCKICHFLKIQRQSIVHTFRHCL